MAEQPGEQPPTQPLQRAPTTRRKRALLICAEDTPQAAAACEWALSNVYQEGDVVHLTYVVKCLMQPIEVFHGMPGTAYSFSPPGVHREQALIDDAKKRLEERFLPLLQPQMVPYQLHLYAERADATVQRVAEIIQEDIEKTEPTLIIMAAHNKPGTQEGLGSVAEYLSRNCKRPMAIVHPDYAVGTGMGEL